MRVISRDRLKAEKGISYSPDHLRRLERKGEFPLPVQLGAGRVAYLEQEIDRWLEQRAAARRPA